MKRSLLTATKPRTILTQSAGALIAFALTSAAQGQTSTWNADASDNWSVASRWAGSIIADGVDNTANFRFNITATRTVTVNTSRTIGNLVFEDLTTSSNDWVLAASGGSILTLDVTTGSPTITTQTGRIATISAVLGGTDGVRTAGAGTLILSGVNTFTGGLTLSGATLVQLNNASGAGTTNAVSYASGATGRLLVNGGVTLPAGVTFNIGTGITSVAGRGLIEQAGTGQGIVNGAINITGSPTNGGMFWGGAAAGNELVLNGAITSTVQVTQRDGRVIYRGGGTGYTSMGITGTAIVGVNDGLSTTAVPQIALSGVGTLDLGAFNQSLPGVTFAATNVGTLTSTTGVLSLNGTLASSGNFTHVLNGNLDLGGAARDFNIGNGTLDIDMTSAASISNGTVTKIGTGTLSLNGTSSANVTVNAGTIAGTGTLNGVVTVNSGTTVSPGTSTGSGTLTINALTLNAGANANFNVAGTSDRINVTAANGLTTTAGVTIRIVSGGGPIGLGTTDLIGYSGTIQGAGLAGLGLVGVGHATAALEDTGTAVRLNVTQATDAVVWTGATNTTWDNGIGSVNWKFQTSGTPTSFLDGDDVLFADLSVPGPTTVDVASPVMPSRVVVNNTTANPYTFTGAGIVGMTGLTKNGNGTLILGNSNSYVGQTVINQGVLELDADTGTLVAGNLGTSGVAVATGATFRVTRDDAAFTFDRQLSGTGTVEINPHSVTGGSVSHAVSLTGNNTGFSGILRLVSPQSGTYRIGAPTPANLGSAAIEVQTGAQILTAQNQTYTNAITIAGTGYTEAGTSGNIGALRLDTGAVWAGPVIVNGSARIGAHNTTGTISGEISGGDLTVNATNFNNSYTVIFTGTNSYATTTIGGQNTQTAGVPSMRLNIGNGGTTGTLGTGNVTINGDGANGVLGFDRSNGYTLLPGQTITGAGSQPTRVFIDVDTLGAGFSDNGNTITLGNAGIAAGGNVRIAQARANAVANITGTLTAERVVVSSAQTGGVLNIGGGANISANYLTGGEVAGGSGTINQAASSTVSVVGQLRLGHFGTNTSTYNMNGGVLTLTGASPNNHPSTAGAGNTTTVGDNNLNITNPTTIVGGGIYLGIDGTGIFNHNDGTVTTNWIVLDNRGDTGAGGNMPDGIDRYNLNGGILNIRSSYGLVQRNASAAVRLTGGTIRVDNTGTGMNTGANLNIPLDANIAVAGVGPTLDSNGAGNAFTLSRNVLGSASMTLTGGGTLNLTPTGMQEIAAALVSSGTGLSLVKSGTGSAFLTGSGAGFTGSIAVNTGRLDVPANIAASSITVAAGAALGGEPTVAALTLNNGSTLFINGSTPAAATAATLTVNGTPNVDFSAPPTAPGPITVVNYGAFVGVPAAPALANAADYRGHTFDISVPGTVTLSVTTKSLTWTGATNATWSRNADLNWNDSVGPDAFFAGDVVSFLDGVAPAAVAVSSGVSPWKTTVNSNTTNYTLTSTGNGIAGPGSLEKSGTSTLTLVNANTYSGKTVINGGVVSIAAPTSLGNGSVTNSIEIDGGTLTATASMDLGSSRAIAVGAGGATFSAPGAAALAVTIPGNLSGTGPITFTSGVTATPPTFILSGDNSGYTGNITVNSAGATAAATTLRLTNNNAFTSGTITLLNPTVGATGIATGLDLPGVTLGSGVSIAMNSFLSGANSYRTQITSGGAVINGPISLAGDTFIQINSSGLITLNGPITAGPGGFTSALLIRGGGQGVVNGTINLPGALLNKTDAATWTINSTGNNWATTNVQNAGSLRIGAHNALPITSTLNIGQGSDASNSLFDLNGFNQEVANITYTAGNGNSTRAITNSSATQSTLTVRNSVDTTYGANTGVTGGLITGSVVLVKEGTGTLTLGAANTFTGNVTVNNGKLVGGGTQTTSLGSATTAGRTFTINSPGSLEFTTNNVFGNGIGNNNLPTVILNGATFSSTRYNVVGTLTLNGATLTQAATDAGNYEGFQFRGNVTVIGTSASTIATTNGKADHLGPNTVFNVADVTGSGASDLLISAPLRNQSGDFALGVGGLTKTGAGTMEISSVSSYTGATVVNEGVLFVTGSISGSTLTLNADGILAGPGTVGPINVIGGTIAPGASPGTLTSGGLNLDSAAVLQFELAQPGTVGGGINDLLVVNGPLTLDGNLQVAELPGFDLGTYRLANYFGALTDNGLTIDSLFLAAHPGSFVDTGTAGEINLVVVPEPATGLVLLGGIGTLLGLRRRRGQRS